MPPSRFRFFVQAGRSFKPRFAISLQFKSRHEKHRTWKIEIAWTPPKSRNNQKRTSLAWPKQVTEKKREVIGSADNRARKNAHTHTRGHRKEHTHAHTRIDIDMNTHTHASTSEHKHMHAHTHAHASTCVIGHRSESKTETMIEAPNRIFFSGPRVSIFFYFRDLFQPAFQSYYRRNFFVNNHLLLSWTFSLRTCENRGRNLRRWRLWLLSYLSRMQNNYFCW